MMEVENPLDQSLTNESQFLADLNTRMQVPERISAVDGERLESVYRLHEIDPVDSQTSSDRANHLNKMFVPETIVVTEDNRYRKGIKLASFEQDEIPFVNERLNRSIELITPPNTLTLSEFEQQDKRDALLMHQFEKERDMYLDDDEELGGSNHIAHNAQTIANQSVADVSMISASDPAIFGALKKQVRFLNRRVSYLEKENQNRQQREILLYTFGFVYFSMKGFLWLRKFI